MNHTVLKHLVNGSEQKEEAHSYELPQRPTVPLILFVL